MDLFDAYPGEGIGITEIKSSDPQRLQVEQIVGFEPNHPPEDSDVGVNPRADFRHRHRLRIKCLSGSQVGHWFRGAITIIPDSAEMPPLTIPVNVRTRAPSYQVSPEKLILVLPDAETSAQRRIKFEFRPGEPSDVTVLKTPDFLEVKIETENPKTKVIDVNFRIQAKSEPSGDMGAFLTLRLA